MSHDVEQGKIASAIYGKEDHGILTCIVHIDFEGSTQGFGCLALDDKTGPDFVRSLCEVFGVDRLTDLRGKQCRVFRFFGGWNAQIDAIESESGAVFDLWTWRRKFDPSVKSPIEERREVLERQLAGLRRQVEETERAIEDLEGVRRDAVRLR